MMFDEFIFSDYAYDDKSGILLMRYAYKDGPHFVEKLVFPLPSKSLSKNESLALDRCFRLIFLLSGVSYYKAYIPCKLSCSQFQISSKMAAFLSNVYLNGLAEFAFQNGLDLADRLNFIIDDTIDVSPVRLQHSTKLLVPVGGGKDSIVTIDTLKNNDIQLSLFVLGSEKSVAKPILDTIEVSEVPVIFVKRSIAENLFELNKSGAFNGHIPITAILSSIACAVAIMHGFGSIVLSNEHSASAPNLSVGSFKINHQYSKSIEFEKDFLDFIHYYITKDLNYFSLLRSLTEAEIVKRFSLLEKYHHIFRSCNKSFRYEENLRLNNWCCDCPKCRFIFLALASFLDKTHLISIFGKNMLDDESQIAGYKELCGFWSHKPFECVGEVEECVLLMYKLYKMSIWENEKVVRQLGDVISNSMTNFDARYRALFDSRHESFAPSEFRKMIDEI